MRHFLIVILVSVLICFGCQKRISIAEENPKLISIDIPDTLKQGIIREYYWTDPTSLSRVAKTEYCITDSTKVIFLLKDWSHRTLDTVLNEIQTQGIYSFTWDNTKNRKS